MSIQFIFDKKTSLRQRRRLKEFIFQQSKKEKLKIKTLNIIFTSDKNILDINKKFLNHNYFTDIITFQLGKNIEGVDAEMYVSIETVINNAIDYQRTITNELHRVIFHGILHLCGYKDKTKKDFNIMKRKEDQWLSDYFNVPRETKTKTKTFHVKQKST